MANYKLSYTGAQINTKLGYVTQDMAVTASPTFVGLTLSGLTNSRLVYNNSGALVSSAITESVLSTKLGYLNQGVLTTSSPLFEGLTIIKNQNSSTYFLVDNQTDGNSAATGLYMSYNANSQYGAFRQFAPSYSAAGLIVGNSVCIYSYNNANGLRLFTRDAYSLIIGTNNTARLTINSSGAATFSNSVDCGNSCEADAYTVGGVAGIDFSGAITNLTTVKGIVTAAS